MKEKKGKWKILKFWDTFMLDNGEYAEGWNYEAGYHIGDDVIYDCLLYTSPSPRDVEECRLPSSA